MKTFRARFHRRVALGLTALVVMTTLHAAGVPPAAAAGTDCVGSNVSSGSVAILPTRLPARRGQLSAVWTGTEGFVVGGATGSVSGDVLRFDPCAETLAVASARLSPGRFGIGAAWTGDRALLFGGDDGSRHLALIDSYNPATDTVSRLPISFPSARRGVAAVPVGDNVYLFGGQGDGPTLTDAILRYHVPTGVLTTLAARLPTPRAHAVAAWTGTAILLAGGDGYTCPERVCADVMRFDPATETLTPLTVKLPSGRMYAAAFAQGSTIHILGGCFRVYDGGGHCATTDEILLLQEGGVTVAAQRLPSPRMAAGIVWTGTSAYVFGGQSDWQGDTTSKDEILRYRPPEAAATAGSVERIVAADGLATRTTLEAARLDLAERLRVESLGLRGEIEARSSATTALLETKAADLEAFTAADGGRTRDALASLRGWLESGVGDLRDRAAEVLRGVATDGNATRALVEGLRSEQTEHVTREADRVAGAAVAAVEGTRADLTALVERESDETRRWTGERVADLKPHVTEDGGRTRGLVRSLRDWISPRVETILASLDGWIPEARARLASVETGLEAVGRDSAEAAAALRRAEEAKPLAVTFAAGTKPGVWYVLVTLDGSPAPATLSARSGVVRWTPLEREPGVFVLDAAAIPVASDERPFVVEARLGSHAGSALLVVPPGLGSPDAAIPPAPAPETPGLPPGAAAPGIRVAGGAAPG